MAIVVFQHGEHVGPGRFGATFRDHGFSLDVRRLDLPPASGGSSVPEDYDNVDGVLALGGEQNVGDPLPWLDQEADYLRGAHEREIPVIGICLGAQLIAHGLGGTVAPMPTPEVGFHTVSLNPVGQVDPLLGGIAWDSPQFCSHGREITALPNGAVLLASSAACRVQCFRVGLRTFAVQYHPECDRGMIDRFCSGCSLMPRVGLTQADISAQADRHGEIFSRLADRLCVNLVTLLFPASRR